MKKILLICLILFSTACSKNKESEVIKEKVYLNADQAIEMISKEELFILDVRTNEEYDECHLDNAILIPHDEIKERKEEIPRDKKILIYCRSGNRAGIAASYLKGYEIYVVSDYFSNLSPVC